MRPDPAKVLYAAAGALAVQVVPELTTPFAQQTAGLGAGLMVLIAQEFDRAAAMLVEENTAVTALLVEGAGLVEDDDLRARLQAAGAMPATPNLLVSTLQARNDDLRRLLVELHAFTETTSSEPAEALNARIWDELRESTRRRHLVAGP